MGLGWKAEAYRSCSSNLKPGRTVMGALRVMRALSMWKDSWAWREHVGQAHVVSS